MEEDTSVDRQLGVLAITGAHLETPRPDHAYRVDLRRSGGRLVLRVYEDSAPTAGVPAGNLLIAEMWVRRGALPRVLDVLQRVIIHLGAAPEWRTRLSNLDPVYPEDTLEREPYRDTDEP